MAKPSSPDPQVGCLERVFQRRPVAVLDQLRRALGASASTVFRVLDRVGYLTSYSHAGKYYTLRSVPSFDTHGLWFCGEVRFSTHGTLRATLVFLVRQAPAGHTHEELEALLGLRVHDTLRSLVETHHLGREQVAAVYVYVDTDSRRATVQLEHRRAMVPRISPPRSAEPQSDLDLARVVEVLLAVIHHPRHDVDRLVAHLGVKGIVVTAEQVQEVLTRYHVKKKTARSRSRRSRR